MKLSLFDAFAKAKGDYVLSRTSSGAIITLTSVIVALALAISEFTYFQQIRTENHVKIDTRPGERNLTIALDIAFFHLTCPGELSCGTSPACLSSPLIHGACRDWGCVSRQ